jgi:hypothetical protein
VELVQFIWLHEWISNGTVTLNFQSAIVLRSLSVMSGILGGAVSIIYVYVNDGWAFGRNGFVRK